MSDFKIEKGIPVPVKIRKRKYPFREMEVGDSIMIAGMRAASQISWAVARHKPKRFVTRVEEDGLRVWRTE